MPYLIAMLISAVLSSGGAWLIQDWRHGIKYAELEKSIADDAKEAAEKAATEKVEAVNEARAEERRHVATINNALKEATKRAQIHRDNAAATRREYDSLRDNLDALKAGMPFLTERAVRDYADTLSGVFSDCTARYTEMGERADGHASDVQTLMEGWPK